MTAQPPIGLELTLAHFTFGPRPQNNFAAGHAAPGEPSSPLLREGHETAGGEPSQDSARPAPPINETAESARARLTSSAPGKLFVGNAGRAFASRRAAQLKLTVGAPRATTFHTVAELEARDVVGLYAS